MAGYKVMLRVIAILIVLGVIGFGIYYFVSGGFSNAKSAYNTYKAVENSEETEYMQNLSDEKIDLLGAYGVDGAKFRKYYQVYCTFGYILDEMGDELYFATKNAKGLKDVEGKYSSYQKALKNVCADFRTFDNSYNAYTSSSSAGGETLTPWEESELKKLAPIVFSSTQNLSQKACELSGSCYNFVVNGCLGGNVYGNLKYTMLKAEISQTEVLFYAILDGKSQTDINAYANDSSNGLQKYKNEKATNFASELNSSSQQYSFKHLFYSLTEEELEACYESANKTEFINEQTGNNKEALQTTCKTMGWIL